MPAISRQQSGTARGARCMGRLPNSPLVSPSTEVRRKGGRSPWGKVMLLLISPAISCYLLLPPATSCYLDDRMVARQGTEQQQGDEGQSGQGPQHQLPQGPGVVSGCCYLGEQEQEEEQEE